MGMTIDESKEWLKLAVPIKALTQEEFATFIQAVNLAVDTMRKYQQIEQILDDWNNQKINNIICCLDIKEVIEDGNDLSSGLAKNSKKLEKDFGESDCINRAELLKAMDTWDKFGYTETGCFVREPKGDYVPYVHYEDMVNCVKGMASVTPQDPRKGHWKDIPKYKDIAWQCSECEHFTTMKHNYCPNCGCAMVEPQESEG